MKTLKPIQFVFPLKGLDVNSGADAQPEGTSPSMSNVLPYDTAHRARGGQRPGNSKLLTTAFGSGNKIDGLAQATLAISPGAIEDETILSDDFTARIGTFLSDDVNGNEWGTIGTVTGTDADSIEKIIYTSSFEDEFFGTQSDAPVQDYGDGTGVVAYDFQKGGWWDCSQAFVDDTTFEGMDEPLTYRVSCDTISSSVTKHGVYACWRGATGNAGGTVIFYIDRAASTSKIIVLNDTGGILATLGTAAFTVTSGDECNIMLQVDRTTSPPTFKSFVNGVQTISATSALTGAGVWSFRAGFIHTRRAGGALFGNAYLMRNFLVERDVIAGKDTVGFRATKLVVAANGSIYSGPVTGPTLATGGTAAYTAGYKPSMTELSGSLYLVDGSAPSATVKKLDLSTNTVTTLAAATGKGTVPTGCRIAVTYFGALVLANKPGGEQNVFLSRVGDPTDWLFGQTDELSAMELNGSDAGHIGQPVLALVPWRDDVLIIGGDHSIYALNGHPAAGGRIDTISDSVGMYGQDAWAVAPDGAVYFVGSGGFYKMMPGGQPVNLSKNRLGNTFTAINRKRNWVEVEYDRVNHGVWIYITPIGGGATYAVWYDERTDGFFPCAFPSDHGPTAALVYDGDSNLDCYLILGGRDGILRKMNAAKNTDDGEAIVSYVYIGPKFASGSGTDVILESLKPTLATNTTQLQYSIRTGDDAQTALTNDESFSGTWTSGGRLQDVRKRARGCCYFLLLFNTELNTTWGMESITGQIVQGGALRKTR